MTFAWVMTVLAILYVSLCMVCKWDKTAQYYIKTVCFAAWYMFTAILVIPCALFKPGDTSNMGWWSFWVKYLQTPWLFGCTLKFVNIEELNYDGPCIIVCNHQTAFDQVAVLEVWPRGRCVFLAKKSLKYAGPFGLALMLSGTLFVDRKNKEKAKNETTQQCIEYMNEKKGKLWVYPEGTRSGNRDEAHMLPFKKGAFHMAVKGQVPIIPVILSGHKHTYSDINKTFDNVEITISVLPKIPTSGMTEDDVTPLTNNVRQMMLETYFKTTPHIKQQIEDSSKDDVVSKDKTSTPDESVENLTTKSDESGETAMLKEFHNQDNQKADIQSLDSDPIPEDSHTQVIETEKEPLEELRADNHDGQVEGQSSSNDQLNEHTASADDAATSGVDALNETETKQNKDNDDSPSSNASADSFVFVDSSKLDDKTDVAALNDDAEIDVGKSIAEEEEPLIKF